MVKGQSRMVKGQSRTVKGGTTKPTKPGRKEIAEPGADERKFHLLAGKSLYLLLHPHIDRELDLLQKQLLLHQWLNRLLRLLLLGQQNHNQLHNPIYWVNCWIPLE